MLDNEQLHASARQENRNESAQEWSGNPAIESSGKSRLGEESGGAVADWLHLFELLEPFLSVGRMSAGLAHNLNGFLAGLIGHLEVMTMKRPELGQELDTVLMLARKLRDGIAEFATKLDNEVIREPQPQNINQILRAILSFLRADLFFKHSVKVELALQEPLPNVYGFYADFSLALEDVLLNALDAQRENSAGWIRIKTSSEGDRVRIEIEDRGSGFSEEALATAFQPMPSEVITHEDGAVRGRLGLALARARLERWGGNIAVGNRAAGGARVIITLPRREKVPVK